ncbi:hypothetical protein [Streptomyces violascens]|uniref:hypothetical protein n=1 Tax=Streptomyces violascens TaxID=67381 RepID=UPI003655911C
MSSLLPTGRARRLLRMPLALALSTAAVFGATAAQAPTADQITINTPTNAVVCQPLTLTWSGGEPPYQLKLLPGDQPSGPALRDFGQQDGTTYTWTVDLPPGTSVGLTLQDSTGAIAQSAPFTINGGSDTSCVQ